MKSKDFIGNKKSSTLWNKCLFLAKDTGQVKIEATFFNRGSKVFTFDTRGLTWEIEKPIMLFDSVYDHPHQAKTV